MAISITPKKQSLRIALMSAAVLIVAAIAFGAYYLNSQRVQALDGFQPGNIISDHVMGNRGAMSESEIRKFINIKNASCGSGNSLCLRNYREGGKDAARIIYEASQEQRINPQVILVTIQKEQGLVTTTNPQQWKYNSAMGYNCPDSTPGKCGSEERGFLRQVIWGSTMFRAILDGGNSWKNRYDSGTRWYTPYIVGSNQIQYHPNASCGKSTVNIKNRATQALYNYTPYRPNDAALKAGYGEGDSCSSYGNRNFFLYFRDWFGSSLAGYDFSFERLVGASPSVKKVSDTSASQLGSYSTTITSGKRIHTFYYDANLKSLRHSLWDGSKWTEQILDGNGATRPGTVKSDVGQGITATVYYGEVQLFYRDATNGSLRHAWTSKGQWKFETLDGTSNSLSKRNANVGTRPKVITYNGQLQLFYYDTSSQALRHAWWDGDSWKFEHLDGTKESVSGKDINVGNSQVQGVAVHGRDLQIVYYDATNTALRHSWWNGKKWSFEHLDGTSGSVSGKNISVGENPSIVSWKGQVQSFYYDATNKALRHAWWTGREWKFETLNGTSTSVLRETGEMGSNTSAVTVNGRIAVTYYNRSTGGWQLAYFDNGWSSLALDGGPKSISGSTSSVGGQLSIAPYLDKKLQIFYRDNSGGLKHAWTR